MNTLSMYKKPREVGSHDQRGVSLSLLFYLSEQQTTEKKWIQNH